MCDLPEEIVAHRMSQAVVDHLEAIEVQKQHREMPVFNSAVAVDRNLDAIADRRAVGQPSQRIVEREPL